MANDLEKRQHFFERAKDELVAAQRSNAEQFDRAVLTLSAGFLALSASFMKDVVPLAQMVHAWILYLSWILFACAISLALLGMLYGQHLLKKLIKGAEAYYIEQVPDAQQLSVTLPRRIDYINIAVGVLFSCGVLLTVAFLIANLEGREMADGQARIPSGVDQRGQPANTFPKVPISPPPPAADAPKPVPDQQQSPSPQSK